MWPPTWASSPTTASSRTSTRHGNGQDRRNLTEPTILFTNPRVHKGAVLYAALLYQARSAPQGFDGYEDAFTGSTEGLWRARELVGADPGFA